MCVLVCGGGGGVADKEGVKGDVSDSDFWDMGELTGPYAEYLHSSSDTPVTLLGAVVNSEGKLGP